MSFFDPLLGLFLPGDEQAGGNDGNAGAEVVVPWLELEGTSACTVVSSVPPPGFSGSHQCVPAFLAAFAQRFAVRPASSKHLMDGCDVMGKDTSLLWLRFSVASWLFEIWETILQKLIGCYFDWNAESRELGVMPQPQPSIQTRNMGRQGIL